MRILCNCLVGGGGANEEIAITKQSRPAYTYKGHHLSRADHAL